MTSDILTVGERLEQADTCVEALRVILDKFEDSDCSAKVLIRAMSPLVSEIEAHIWWSICAKAAPKTPAPTDDEREPLKTSSTKRAVQR